MRKIKISISLLFLSLIFLPLLSACTAYAPTVPKFGNHSGNFTSDAGDASSLLSANSLLVLPLIFESATLEHTANRDLFYGMLTNAFRSDVDMEVRADNEILKGFDARDFQGCLKYAKRSAARYGTDSVLCTVLHRFVERTGSSVGSENPAALSFSMEMLRISDGKRIWGGSFVFKDEALSDNILSLQEHIAERGSASGWQSARSTLERGFREASQDFSRRRLEKFAPGQF